MDNGPARSHDIWWDADSNEMDVQTELLHDLSPATTRGIRGATSIAKRATSAAEPLEWVKPLELRFRERAKKLILEVMSCSV